MHDIHWCNRVLIENPYHYCLVLDEKSYHKELKRLKVSNKNPWLNNGADATVHFLYKPETNKHIAIVCIEDTNKEVSDTQKVALLVHEAVHIWQHVEAHLGELDTSREFEAYSIQGIVQELLISYDKAKASKRKKKPRVKKD